MIKFYNLCIDLVDFVDMAPLPPREQRHPFLRYQGLEYFDQDIANFKERLEMIHNKDTHRVQVLDFKGMPKLMRDVLYDRMLMEHRGDDRVMVFTISVRRGHETYELKGVHFSSGITYREKIESPSFARRFATGRKSGALISGGQFVARLAEHFGLLTEERLYGLTAWVPAGPARQEGNAGGVVEEASVALGGGDEDEEMPQAVPPPPRT
ncbi:hypothetical protein Tco_0375229 [Tanacetum coccineum]